MSYFSHKFEGKVFDDLYRERPWGELSDEELTTIIKELKERMYGIAMACDRMSDIEREESSVWPTLNSAQRELDSRGDNKKRK